MLFKVCAFRLPLPLNIGQVARLGVRGHVGLHQPPSICHWALHEQGVMPPILSTTQSLGNR